MVDGVAENQTAAMLTPYRDSHGHDTDNSGLSFIDPTRLREIVTSLDAAGFQVHFHALGDRAVREALDAIEAARAGQRPDRRPPSPRPPAGRRRGRDRPVRRARRRREPAGALGDARRPDRRPHAAVPAGRPGGAPVPVRRPRSRRRAARGRQRLAGLERRPARRDPHRRQPGRARASTPNRSAAPTSASTWRRRWLPTPPAPPT